MKGILIYQPTSKSTPLAVLLMGLIRGCGKKSSCGCIS